RNYGDWSLRVPSTKYLANLQPALGTLQFSTAFGSILLAATIATGGLHAQQAAKTGVGPRSLTPQDRIDIQQLIARYAFAYDSGADNCFAFADLFTPDGEFVGQRGRAQGREALAAYCRGGRKPAIGVSHFIMNPVIDVTRDGVTGR